MDTLPQAQTGESTLALKLPEILPDNTLTLRLHERRISAEVIAEFGIVPSRGSGWVYPLPEGGYQWKNHNSNAAYKYLWCDEAGNPGTKPASKWYYGPDLLPAIRSAGNTIWLVSGAPDVWAMYSAGIHHVVSSLGEYAPEDLAQRLQELGILVVYLAPDLDETGRAFASQVEGALADAGIELDCRELPASLGPKGDIGRAWQQYNRGIPFERYLTGLHRWYPKPPEKIVKEYLRTDNETEIVPQGYKDEICAHFHVLDWDTDGWSKYNVCCPFHDDEHPSASINSESGLWCHTEKHFYLWRELGQVLGIGSIRTWKLANLQYRGLTTEIREGLILRKYSTLARLLDLLFVSGFHSGDSFTRTDVYPLFDGVLSEETIKTGTRELRALFAPIVPNSCLGAIKTQNKQGRGRKSTEYRIPTIHELEQALDIKQGRHFDVIPVTKLARAPEYNAEVHAEFIRRNPGAYPLSLFTKRLGKCANTIRAYNRRANILTIPQEHKRDEMEPEMIAKLPDRVVKKERGLRWIETPDDQKYPAERGAAILALQRLANNGQPFAKLTLVTRRASHYEPERATIKN